MTAGTLKYWKLCGERGIVLTKKRCSCIVNHELWEMIGMWMFYAIGSAFFAGITAILAKCGIRETDSDVATAIRTIVVLLFSWLMVLITGTWPGIMGIDGKTLLFLVLLDVLYYFLLLRLILYKPFCLG